MLLSSLSLWVGGVDEPVVETSIKNLLFGRMSQGIILLEKLPFQVTIAVNEH